MGTQTGGKSEKDTDDVDDLKSRRLGRFTPKVTTGGQEIASGSRASGRVRRK